MNAAKEEYWSNFKEVIYRLDRGPYYYSDDFERWVAYTLSEMKSKLLTDVLEFPPDYLSTYDRKDRNILKREIDEFLTRVSTENRVDFAGPLAGRSEGFREFNGTRMLVTQGPQLVEPSEGGEWEGLRNILERMFGEEQIHYFYSWLKRVLQSVLFRLDFGDGRVRWHATNDSVPLSTQFFAICGPVNSGKTWLQEAVISEMLGGSVSPNQYMSEGTPFNGDLFRVPHQMISDAKGSSSYEKRRTFGSFVKELVANDKHRCHGKGDKAIDLDPVWVVTCSCNTSPIERLRILPPLEEDTRDKMIITLVNPGKMPFNTSTPEGKEEFRQWTKKQLPGLAWWLLNEYTIPAGIAEQDRFGIKGYCHPQIEGQLLELSPDAKIRDYIHSALFTRGGQNRAWKGSAEELAGYFNTDDGRRLLRGVKGQLPHVLSRLKKAFPGQFTSKKNNSQRFWVIHPPRWDEEEEDGTPP